MSDTNNNKPEAQVSPSPPLSERTSAAQLRCIASLLACGLQGIGRHLKRFSAIYGFLAGAVTTLLILAAIIWYGVFAYPLPWKVTDPTDPRFNPQNFRFTDYENSRELGEALRAIFPLGTEKEIVDLALGKAGASVPNKGYTKPNVANNYTFFLYNYRNPRSEYLEYITMTSQGEFSWRVTAAFDDDGRLKEIRAIGP